MRVDVKVAIEVLLFGSNRRWLATGTGLVCGAGTSLVLSDD